MGNKVLIIEPHGDDAICSCSSILVNKLLDIDIVTLGNSRSSEGIKEIFHNVNNVLYYELPDFDFSMRLKVSTHDLHRRYQSGENVYQYYMEKFNNFIDPSIKADSINSIKEILCKINFDCYDYVVYPFGLVHPYHILVNEACDQIFKNLKCTLIMYGDKPYLGNRYAREILFSKCRSDNLKSLSLDSEYRDNIVKGTLSKIYPTETNMLRFSSDILLNSPDIYLSYVDLSLKEDLFNENFVCNAI